MTKLRPALGSLLDCQACQTPQCLGRDLGNLPWSSTAGVEVLITFPLSGLQGFHLQTWELET